MALEKTANLVSPEGVMMLLMAGALDIFGILCLILDIAFGVGEIISYVPDGIGMVFFGLWMFMRSQTQATEKPKEVAGKVVERREKIKGVKKKVEKIGKKGEEVVKKAAKKGLRSSTKFGLAFLGEITPFIGALPFWTIMVYFELKS